MKNKIIYEIKPIQTFFIHSRIIVTKIIAQMLKSQVINLKLNLKLISITFKTIEMPVKGQLYYDHNYSLFVLKPKIDLQFFSNSRSRFNHI